MDPVKEFFADLKSPDPSIRFSVLSRIEDLAWDEQQQAALKKLLEQEQNPGIKFHMLKVLARLDQSKKEVVSAAEIEQLLQKNDRDEISLALMLEAVKKVDAHLVIGALREKNWPAFSSQLLPSVLKFLKKYGSFEDVAEIEQLCRHPDPRVLSSAVEALEKISPERLKDLIVPLLVNPNFGIRSRAVRLLHRWDPNEALRHFEAMLFCQVESEKQAALFHAFFFPFDQIEKFLLRFISIEKDSELIKKAGLLFMANPTGQSPARLLEVRQSCVGEKFRLIDQILKGVLTSLFQARIVKATPEQMLEVLEDHYRQKRIKLFIERYRLALQSEDEEVRLKSAIKLCDLARYNVEEAVSLVEVYLAHEKSSTVKKKVAEYLLSCRPAATEVEPAKEEKSEGKPPEKLEPEKFLQNIDANNFFRVYEFACANFRDLSVELQISAIKAIEQFGKKEHSALPSRALKSDNNEVLAASIDCLSKIDADAILPYLPQLIKHNSDEVREAAIKVFALFDKEQAIALVEKLMFSIKPVQRRQAVFCCGHFDFQAIAHLILKALKIEADPENQQQLKFLLLSNADEELFYRLYADYKNCNSSRRPVYEEICNRMAEQLSSGENPISRQKLYEVAIQKLEEEEKCKVQRQSYKLEKIQKIRRDGEKKFGLDVGLVKFAIVAYSIGAVLTCVIWFLFLAPPASKNTRVKDAQRPNLKLRRAVMVKGPVAKVDSVKKIIEVQNEFEEGKIYRISLGSDFGRLPKVGETFNAQVKPLSEGEEVVAEIIAAF